MVSRDGDNRKWRKGRRYQSRVSMGLLVIPSWKLSKSVGRTTLSHWTSVCSPVPNVRECPGEREWVDQLADHQEETGFGDCSP